jgi:hypothetical protein
MIERVREGLTGDRLKNLEQFEGKPLHFLDAAGGSLLDLYIEYGDEPLDYTLIIDLLNQGLSLTGRPEKLARIQLHVICQISKENCDLELIKLLVLKGCPVDQGSLDSALTWAITYVQISVVVYLL